MIMITITNSYDPKTIFDYYDYSNYDYKHDYKMTRY